MSILKRVLKAAVAQPWEYVGEGAPQEWEMRVSPDGQHFAVFNPERGTWVFMDARSCAPVAEVDTPAEMDEHTGDWDQYLRLTEPDE